MTIDSKTADTVAWTPLHYVPVLGVLRDEPELEAQPRPRTIHQAIGEAVGAASMCWENPRGAGVFDSTRAAEVVNGLYEELATLFRAELLAAVDPRNRPMVQRDGPPPSIRPLPKPTPAPEPAAKPAFRHSSEPAPVGRGPTNVGNDPL